MSDELLCLLRLKSADMVELTTGVGIAIAGIVFVGILRLSAKTIDTLRLGRRRKQGQYAANRTTQVDRLITIAGITGIVAAVLFLATP